MIIPIKYSKKPGANIIFRIIAKLKSSFLNRKEKSINNIPVIINNFNRLNYLKQQLQWLEKIGMQKIYIIDNASTYKPVLDFYKKTKYPVFKLNENVGNLALWKTHIFLYFKNTNYIYTDPDVVPVTECPNNVIKYFISILDKYPQIEKVGFALKIDDIPDHYHLKQKVINWEKQYWEKEIEENIFDAKIDTTFALYRPNVKGGWEIQAARTGFPYLAKHLPWYVNTCKLNEEELFYTQTATNAGSWYTIWPLLFPHTEPRS